MLLRNLERTLIVAAVIIAAGLYTTAASAEWKLEPLLMFQHTSDILHGCPVNCDQPDALPTQDYLAGGATLSSPRRASCRLRTHGEGSIVCSKST